MGACVTGRLLRYAVRHRPNCASMGGGMWEVLWGVITFLDSALQVFAEISPLIFVLLGLLYTGMTLFYPVTDKDMGGLGGFATAGALLLIAAVFLMRLHHGHW